jgi:hypothetical protein
VTDILGFAAFVRFGHLRVQIQSPSKPHRTRAAVVPAAASLRIDTSSRSLLPNNVPPEFVFFQLCYFILHRLRVLQPLHSFPLPLLLPLLYNHRPHFERAVCVCWRTSIRLATSRQPSSRPVVVPRLPSSCANPFFFLRLLLALEVQFQEEQLAQTTTTMISDKYIGLLLAILSTMAIGTSFVITKMVRPFSDKPSSLPSACQRCRPTHITATNDIRV